MTGTPVLGAAVDVRAAGPGDAQALLALHHAGFGSDWTLAQWRWRFVDNPLGRTEIVGAFTADGACVASFCGVPLPCRFGGDLAIAQRAGDVTVHPRLRAGVGGSGLLLRIAERFFATFGGGATRLVFGFPEDGLCRTIVRHCRFDVLADVAVLVRAAAAGPTAPAGCSVVAGGEIPADAEGLVQRWWPDGGAGIVRDRRYLRWRYETNPHTRYRVLAARSGTGALRGLAIARDGLAERTLALVEWIVPPADGGAAATLLAAASHVAHEAGAAAVAVSVAGSSPWFAWFQQAGGCRVVMTPHRFVYRSFAGGVDRRFLLQRWCHALGDLDFT